MYHIAQINIARALAPVNDPLLADFAAALDTIYELAESSPGFVWRWGAKDVSPTDPPLPSDERLFATISVWSSLEELRAFVYKSTHAQIMRRRHEWFVRMKSPYIVLWWVPSGHVPDLLEAKERFDYLCAHGPTPFAFTFASVFPMPDLKEDGQHE
jgi:hypothetical protein